MIVDIDFLAVDKQFGAPKIFEMRPETSGFQCVI